MNILDEIVQRIRAFEEATEHYLTYEDACAQLVALLQELINSPDQVREAKKMHHHLVGCLCLIRKAAERDTSLGEVASSLHYLIRILDSAEDPASTVLEKAVEATLLDVQFCISQHE